MILNKRRSAFVLAFSFFLSLTGHEAANAATTPEIDRGLIALGIDEPIDTPYAATDSLEKLEGKTLKVKLHKDFWLKSSAFGEKTFVSLYSEFGTNKDSKNNLVQMPVVLKTSGTRVIRPESKFLAPQMDCFVYATEKNGAAIRDTVALHYDTTLTFEKLEPTSRPETRKLKFRSAEGYPVHFVCAGKNLTVGALKTLFENYFGDVETPRSAFRQIR